MAEAPTPVGGIFARNSPLSSGVRLGVENLPVMECAGDREPWEEERTRLLQEEPGPEATPRDSPVVLPTERPM